MKTFLLRITSLFLAPVLLLANVPNVQPHNALIGNTETTGSNSLNDLLSLLATASSITTRVSVASDGTQGNSSSSFTSISADGRYVAFTSSASNLVNGDTNGTEDIFVHDQQSGQTTRVSVASDGTQANDSVYGYLNDLPVRISADGRYVAFGSRASNLVAADTNGAGDIFVHDRQTGQTTRVSIASDGTQGNDHSGSPSISADGRYVAFLSSASNLVSSDTNGKVDVFVHDRQTGQTTRVSVASGRTEGNDSSWYPFISAEGRYVAFNSLASNLVSGDTNGKADVFVHDRQTGQTTRVSVASDGTQGNDDSGGPFVNYSSPSISTDGRYVAFYSYASNLVNGDTNGIMDVFIHDRQTSQTTCVSVASDGTQGNDNSMRPSISADGRYVAFASGASSLVSSDTNNTIDIFVHDRQTGQTTRVSVASDGTQGNDWAWWPSISADGRYVAFDTDATNMVSGDTNGYRDAFVHDRGGTAYAVSGHITDASSNPVSEATISAGSTFSATTNTSGYYTITGLISGTYMLTPTKSGYTFSPITRTVSVPPDATGQNFTGTIAWTLMYYLDGDNNLDSGYTLPVFNQLEAAANNPNVQIVALLDRRGSSNSAYYRVQYDTDLTKLATYTSTVNYWPQSEVNMGVTETLVSFVNWARVNYPAQHYALILSDHGNGLGGAMWDDTSSGDYLTVKEIGTALASVTLTGTSKIDVLYMDACLMGMIEDAYQMKDYVDYYVASENIKFGKDTPHFQPVTAITATTTPDQLAALFTTTYGDACDAALSPCTMSTADISKLGNLVMATNSLAQLLNSQMATSAITLTTIQSTVQRFEMNGDDVINASDDYVDLYDFARLVKLNLFDSNIQVATQGVMDAVNDYVIIERHRTGQVGWWLWQKTWNLDNSHGVSVFFPTTASSFYNASNYDFAVGATWPLVANFSLKDAQAVVDWGPMLVNYFQTTQPSGPDNPNPPLPLPQRLEHRVYLPVVVRQ